MEDKPFFDFFGLPRELRNNIYSELIKGMLPKPRTRQWPCIELPMYLHSNLRLVNRQFKQEYEQEVLRAASISIELNDCELEDHENSDTWLLLRNGFALGVPLPNIKTLTLRVQCHNP